VKLVYTATPEATNLTTEQGNFLRYTNARRVQSTLFDHTNGAATGYSERLNGGTNEKYGVARSMSVMPGDTIKVQVYAKYADPNTTNWNQTLTNLMSAIASNTGGIVVDGGGYSSSTSSFSFGGLVNTGGSSPSSPKAFLNWIIFDRDYNFKDGGFIQVSQAAKETGTDGPHEKLSKNDILIKEPGYIYIYLSNEETSPVEVFFDDLNVVQVKSPVVQTDDYYPFGGEFNTFKRENSTPNQYKFNGGSELQDELGLEVYLTDYRTYDPWGRLGWWQIDPKVDEYYDESPYNFSHNNPIRYNDPKGDCPPGDMTCLGIGVGFVQGVVSSVTSTVELMGNLSSPSGQVDLAMGAAAVVQNPGAVVDGAVSSIKETGNTLVNGTDFERGVVIGKGAAIAAEVAGAKGLGSVTKIAETGNAIKTVGKLDGSFSIKNWTGYPGGAKPSGTFRLLEGTEYKNARNLANETNKGLRASDPTKYAGKQIHEIKPVKFGGSPTDAANKVPLTQPQHAQYTTFWNNLMRDIKKKP
jgi:RHS repeat-associated protein